MIYGPYKRKGRVQTVKMPQRIRRRGYNARPRGAILCLRIAFAGCLTALLTCGVRIFYLSHTARTFCPSALEWTGIAALSGTAMLLLYLMKRLDRRRS